MLTNGAQKTFTFLNNLTSEHTDASGEVRKAAMPLTAFRGAKGFMIIHRRRYGLLLGSYQLDDGFLTVKRLTADGKETLSPPLFYRRRVFGIGPALGYLRGGTCLALLNDEAVQSQIKSDTSLQIKGRFLVDMNGSHIREIQLDSNLMEENVIQDSHGGMVAQYFRLKALLAEITINISMHGLIKNVNSMLYGDVTPEEVLTGNVPGRASWKDGWCSELSRVRDMIADFTRQASLQRSASRSMGRGSRYSSFSNVDHVEQEEEYGDHTSSRENVQEVYHNELETISSGVEMV